MVFSSVSFLFFFLPALMLIYYIVPRQYREIRNLVLLGFSVFFYIYGGLRFLPVVAASIALNYICGLLVTKNHTSLLRHFFCAAAVVLGLGLLAWFKYSAFLAVNLRTLLPGLPVPDVVLPLGISFFTFHGLSYVIDVYRGSAKVQTNPFKLALYILLFPQLVAGPIIRYSTIYREVDHRQENLTEFTEGAVRFLFGLAKKMLIANALGGIADDVFSRSPETLSMTLSWLGIVSYTAQIYFDFSAYSDMAIGLGKMFGFHFPENFNYPYIARSVTEFWRRWHISLTTWFRDYVYIPLGGNRCQRWKHIGNIAIVWLLTGLWHGAAWTFVAWGLWFFLLLLGEKFIWGKMLEKCPSVVAHIYTMLTVMLSWVFFRSDSLSYAVCYIGAMFGLGMRVVADGQTLYYLLEYWPEFAAAIIAAMPVKKVLQGALEKRSSRLAARLLLTWGPKTTALILLALSYLKLVTGSFNPFIYFRF